MSDTVDQMQREFFRTLQTVDLRIEAAGLVEALDEFRGELAGGAQGIRRVVLEQTLIPETSRSLELVREELARRRDDAVAKVAKVAKEGSSDG